MADNTELVVEGARLACMSCTDSFLRSGPPLKVISQSTVRENGKLVATQDDIGAAIPPFPYCQVLGQCAPAVTMLWQDTKYDLNLMTLQFAKSFTFCEAGQGILITTTSGQSPDEETSREEEIEAVMAYLKAVNEWAKQQDDFGTRLMSDNELRTLATNYVDLMRSMDKLPKDSDGYVDFYDLYPEDQNRMYRLLGEMVAWDESGNPYTAFSAPIDTLSTLAIKADPGVGKRFPCINGNLLMNLTLQSAVPNSWKKNLLITGIVLAAFSAPLWGPPLAGVLQTGAQAAWKTIAGILGLASADGDPTNEISYLGETFGKLGEVVRNPGIQVDWSQSIIHGAEMMAKRGVTPEMVDRWVANGRAFLQSGGQYLFVTPEGAAVVSNTGKLITTYSGADFNEPMIKIIELLFGG